MLKEGFASVTNESWFLRKGPYVFGGIALVLGNILLGPAAIICGFVATKTESPDTARLLRLIGACVGIVGIVMMVIFWPIMITFIVRWIFLYIKWCPDLKQGCKSGESSCRASGWNEIYYCCTFKVLGECCVWALDNGGEKLELIKDSTTCSNAKSWQRAFSLIS